MSEEMWEGQRYIGEEGRGDRGGRECGRRGRVEGWER